MHGTQFPMQAADFRFFGREVRCRRGRHRSPAHAPRAEHDRSRQQPHAPSPRHFARKITKLPSLFAKLIAIACAQCRDVEHRRGHAQIAASGDGQSRWRHRQQVFERRHGLGDGLPAQHPGDRLDHQKHRRLIHPIVEDLARPRRASSRRSPRRDRSSRWRGRHRSRQTARGCRRPLPVPRHRHRFPQPGPLDARQARDAEDRGDGRGHLFHRRG